MPNPTPGQHDALLARADDTFGSELVTDLAAAVRSLTAETERLLALLDKRQAQQHEVDRLQRLIEAGSGCEWVETSDDGTSFCRLSLTDGDATRTAEQASRVTDDCTLAEARQGAAAEVRADNLQIIRDHHAAVTALAEAGRKALDTSRIHVEVIERLEQQLAEARATAPDIKPAPGSWDDRIEAVLLELEDDGDEPIDPDATTFERLEIWRNRAQLAAAHILRHLDARAAAPEPLWRGPATSLVPYADEVDDENGEAFDVVVYRADQLPAGVTREQVLQAVGAGFTTALGPDQGTSADVVHHITDAVWAELHGEGSQ